MKIQIIWTDLNIALHIEKIIIFQKNVIYLSYFKMSILKDFLVLISNVAIPVAVTYINKNSMGFQIYE